MNSWFPRVGLHYSLSHAHGKISILFVHFISTFNVIIMRVPLIQVCLCTKTTTTDEKVNINSPQGTLHFLTNRCTSQKDLKRKVENDNVPVWALLWTCMIYNPMSCFPNWLCWKNVYIILSLFVIRWLWKFLRCRLLEHYAQSYNSYS